MRSIYLSLLAVVAIQPLMAQSPGAQSSIYGNDGPRFDVSVGYQRIQANAPPGICNCFGDNGGFFDANFWLLHRFSITGEISGSHDTNISNLQQNLTLTTFMAGPHVVLPIRRFAPYWEFLAGAAHGSDSYFPSGGSYQTSATSFAFAPGGGLDIYFTPKLSLRAIQVRYLHTSFPNGTSNEQNQLMIGAGVDFRFGHISRWASSQPTPPAPPPPPLPPPPPPSIADVTCVAGSNQVSVGSSLEITAIVQTIPPGQELTYTWTSTSGPVQADGSHVFIDTSKLAPGPYRLTGVVQLGQNESVKRSCDVSFVVVPSVDQDRERREREFKENVHDILFDFNKSDLRPDSLETLRHNAEYLKANPDIKILIDGFADERGAVKYNLSLGERRAHAVLEQLISLGISQDRLQIVTFGHDAQVCTAGNERCWQENRRVGFLIQP
jgi:outer membrane protein OmpA-like peptidoglycan-associated protein/opacity protein-like surface antigen